MLENQTSQHVGQVWTSHASIQHKKTPLVDLLPRYSSQITWTRLTQNFQSQFTCKERHGFPNGPRSLDNLFAKWKEIWKENTNCCQESRGHHKRGLLANVGKEILGYPSISQEPTKNPLSVSNQLKIITFGMHIISCCCCCCWMHEKYIHMQQSPSRQHNITHIHNNVRNNVHGTDNLPRNLPPHAI